MVIEIIPSNIHFSVDIIDNVFHRNSHHCYSRIGETLDSLCEGKIKIRDIPPISVIRYNSGWLTVNNRRLWVFRQMERLGKCARIPVVVVKETAVPTYIAGVKVTVRENPGGIWYLLPSCEMQDPFNTVIWDTAKHIKEFMHPPPSPRIIIKIFENLSQTRKTGKSIIIHEGIIHEGNSHAGDTCSDLQTFSSGYVDVLNNNDVNESEKEPMDKERRTEEWVLDQSVYITVAAQRIELSKEFVNSQTVNVLGQEVTEDEHLKLYYRSVPDYLKECKSVSTVPKFNATDNDDLLSEASELSSGYLCVTCDADKTYRDESNLTDKSEMQSACKQSVSDNKVEKIINLHYEAEPPNINDITNSILYKTQGIFLNRQKTDREKESELRAYIGDVLQSTVAKYKEKCQIYERDFFSLKEETKKPVAVKQKEIETLKKQFKETDRNFQEEIETMHCKSKCHESANPLQGCNATVTKDNSNEVNTAGNYCVCSCHSSNDHPLQDNLGRKTCNSAVDRSDTNSSTLETRESDIIQRLKKENRKLKNRNHRLKQNMQKLKVIQNENLYTFAQSLFLNTRRRSNSE